MSVITVISNITVRVWKMVIGESKTHQSESDVHCLLAKCCVVLSIEQEAAFSGQR